MQYANSVTNMNIVVQQMMTTVQPFMGVLDDGMSVAANRVGDASDKVKELNKTLEKIDKERKIRINTDGVNSAILKAKELNGLLTDPKQTSIQPGGPAGSVGRASLRSRDAGPRAASPQMQTAGTGSGDIAEQVSQYQLLAQSAKISNAAISELNNVQESKQVPTAQEITDHLSTFVDLLGSASGQMQQLGIDTSVVQPIIDSMAQGIQLAATFTDLYTTAQWLLNAAMDANPITLIIIGVMALVGAVMYAWNKFSGFREAVIGVWESMKEFGSMLKDLIIERVKGIIKGIGGIGKAIGLLFDGEFSKAVDTAKQAVGDLSGANAANEATSEMKKAKDTVQAASDIQSVATKQVNNGSNTAYPVLPKFPRDTMFSQQVSIQQANSINRGAAQPTQDFPGSSARAGSITNGGTQKITINIGKFFDNMNITAQTMSEGIDDFERRVEEVFLRIVNSASTAKG